MKTFIILSQMLVLIRNSQTGDTQSTESILKKNLMDQIKAMRGHSSGNSIGNIDRSKQHTLTSRNSNTLVNRRNFEKNEKVRYKTSCFCPKVIQGLIVSYRDLYLNDLNMQEVLNAFNIENNIYYIYHKLLMLKIDETRDKFERAIICIKPFKKFENEVNLLRKNFSIIVERQLEKCCRLEKNQLLSDVDLMKLIFANLRELMICFLQDLYGTTPSKFNSRITFDTVRKGSIYLKFYRALEIINIISLDSDNDFVKLYHEKAFKVYKSYIVGMELLGKTCKKFESILLTSRILIKDPDDNEKKPEIFTGLYLKIKQLQNNVKDLLTSSPKHSDLMLWYYCKFCEKLCDLDKNLNLDYLTEAEWDQNIIDLERICAEMNSILINFLIEVKNTTCYEGKCTLLRIYAELRDCIFQSIDMKSKCIKDSLCLVTFKGKIKKPVYNEEKENTCQGKIKAEDFLDELDKIKKRCGIPNPEKWKNSTLKEYFEANPGRSKTALEERKSRNDKKEKNSDGIP